MSTYKNNIFMPGKDNNYLIGGTLCNAFALGEIGSKDDFFLVASQPSQESNYPIITGNILDSEGKVLFRLVKNLLLINPGNCSKILSDHIGYEIHDSSGKLILKISTKFEYNDLIESDCFITTISANFYNKNGDLVFNALSDSKESKIESFCKSAFGFSGGFGAVQKYDMEELEIVKLALIYQGAIHQKITGEIQDQEIDLEGKFIHNAKLKNCTLNISEGNFSLIGNKIENCKFNFKDKAGNIYNLVNQLIKKN